MNEMRSSQRYTCSREQELVRKGIERLEKQLLQYIDVFISCDQVNIALVKMSQLLTLQLVTYRKSYRNMRDS